VGSSIMPGKVNPVIPEFVISASQRVFSNDVLITSLCARGVLELNAYLPSIGYCVIESIKLMTAACETLSSNLFPGLGINSGNAYAALVKSPSVTTALVPYIGYHNAVLLAREMKDKDLTIFEANSTLKLIDGGKLLSVITPGNLLKLGFSLKDL
jgi:aspartate ammonia-lyase